MQAHAPTRAPPVNNWASHGRRASNLQMRSAIAELKPTHARSVTQGRSDYSSPALGGGGRLCKQEAPIVWGWVGLHLVDSLKLKCVKTYMSPRSYISICVLYIKGSACARGKERASPDPLMAWRHISSPGIPENEFSSIHRFLQYRIQVFTCARADSLTMTHVMQIAEKTFLYTITQALLE